jgi:allantoicase
MADFRDYPDLAAARTGGAVLYATDETLGSADDLLLSTAPAARPLGARDGWESRRRRGPGHDAVIVRLGMPGRVRAVVVDTSFFDGDSPAACILEGVALPGNPDAAALLSDDLVWTELCPRSALAGGVENVLEVAAHVRVTHVRLRVFPDGGVARLRVHGEVLRSPRVLARPEIDLAAIENGGRVLACSGTNLEAARRLLLPDRAVDRGDGWETPRRRGDGPDVVLVALAGRGSLHRAVVDTAPFRGSPPESFALEIADARGRDAASLGDADFVEILPRTKLLGDTLHDFEDELRGHAPGTHVRLKIWPDGGVGRLRLFGTLSREGAEAEGVRYVNALPTGDAERAFLHCCGSEVFARTMAAARPFASLEAMIAEALRVWTGLSHADWDEAFRAHPEIGGKKAEGPQTATSATWSRGEQSKVGSAEASTLAELARGNAAYREKFGRIYIVCATGRSADELLAILRGRLDNGAEEELAVAADEQRKITELRLAKLVLGHR